MQPMPGFPLGHLKRPKFQILVATSAEDAAEFCRKRFPVLALPLMIGYEPISDNVQCLTSQEQFNRVVPSFFEKVPGAHIAFALVESDEAACALNEAEGGLLTFAQALFAQVPPVEKAS